jgi:hypothetical protein
MRNPYATQIFCAVGFVCCFHGAFAADISKGLPLQQASSHIRNAFTIKVPQYATTQAALGQQMTAALDTAPAPRTNAAASTTEMQAQMNAMEEVLRANQEQMAGVRAEIEDLIGKTGLVYKRQRRCFQVTVRQKYMAKGLQRNR